MRGDNGTRSGVYGDGDGHEQPLRRRPARTCRAWCACRSSARPRTTLFVRGEALPWLGDRSRRGIALLLTALVAVIAVGVATGLLVREWRMRARVAKRHELAQQKLASGNYPGFQAAELLYRQILAERDDSEARAQRARVLAQMAFEFGDPTEPAQRAMALLGDDAAAPCADKRPGCQDAAEARVYLAMAHGRARSRVASGAGAAAQVSRSRRRPISSGAPSCCSSGPTARPTRCAPPPTAIRTIRSSLHGLGLAEAAARRDERALEAYRRALQDNANHIATIIDRALLQVERGSDRDAARGALEGVVGKLVGDSSPGQLARAFLGLAELELQKGDVTAARRDLAQAAAKRRDGDALLSRGAGAGVRRRLHARRGGARGQARHRGGGPLDAAAGAGRGGAAAGAAGQGAGDHRGGGHLAARGAGDARAGVADAGAQGVGAARRRGGAAHAAGDGGGARWRWRASTSPTDIPKRRSARWRRSSARRRRAPTWRRRWRRCSWPRSVPDRARWWLQARRC